VVCGLPASWDLRTVFRVHYPSYTWSPCGKFFSTLSSTSVEEWDATTLEKHSILQPHSAPKTEWSNKDYFPGALAYSPDGHSLACFFGTVIVIWDLQTGGVVKEITTNVACASELHTLVWSPDGTATYALSLVEDGAWAVTAYNITSGEEAYSSRVQSSFQPYLWQHNTSLQAMAIVFDDSFQITINIHEIQPNSINKLIESFPVNNLVRLPPDNRPKRISFSPSTYQISAIAEEHSWFGSTLFAIDIRSSKTLLQEHGYLTESGSCFSPDGSLLVASKRNGAFVWGYTPEQGYTLQIKLLFLEAYLHHLQGYRFSPSSSTILMSAREHFKVQHLDGPQPNFPVDRHHAEFFGHGTCVVTASSSESTFTITNLQLNSSQCIDTKSRIQNLIISGNSLLIQGEDVVAGWRLTREGTVDKVLDNRSGECDGRLWTKPLQPKTDLMSLTHDNIGAVEACQRFPRSQEIICFYNRETGVELDSMTASVPQLSLFTRSDFFSFGADPNDVSNSYDLSEFDPTKDTPPHYEVWFQEGWVKYCKGEHQHKFWLSPEWRRWTSLYWVISVTTLSLEPVGHSPIIIKF